MWLMGENQPGGLNSSVVPTASPAANPNKHPLKRSMVSIVNSKEPHIVLRLQYEG